MLHEDKLDKDIQKEIVLINSILLTIGNSLQATNFIHIIVNDTLA